ncbi:hypothetical protein F5148DRAFT_622964 [Russula earlei]|uniref:Uncharacterized protein n=1 Tax=Russula earlei TaxID=71964 RepID=A0ACC0UEZ1_9AGAM|nr:hypothetical protein F5148DRAFT_622964 [Russula earlei]
MLSFRYVVINWSADGLLLFWFSCVFKQAPQWCVVLPVPLYIGSLVTGSLALREIATPGVTQDANELVNWLIIYRTVSVALCVTLTSLIAGRLVYSHRRLDSGSCNPKSRLLIVATMVVESAVLQTVFALVYVITVGLGSPLQNVFLPTLGQVQVVATMLIIYRVVRGRDATQELPHQSDLTQQTMSLRLNTAVATSFNSMGCELSASPTRSWRGFDSPRTLLPPPYAASPFHDHKTKIVPPLPSADAVHMLGLQGAGTKRTMTVRNVG